MSAGDPFVCPKCSKRHSEHHYDVHTPDGTAYACSYRCAFDYTYGDTIRRDAS